MIAEQNISRSFSRAAGHYDDVAIIQREVAQRLAERLNYLKVEVNTVLDLGSGTGFCTQITQKHYPSATFICLDLSQSMLQHARSKGVGKYHIRATATALPVADNSLDLVISSMMLHWCEQPDMVATEVRRVLRPGGLFIFSTCASETLHELTAALKTANIPPPANTFPDIHSMAAMISAAYSDTVLDKETIQLLRPDLKGLISVLRRSGTLPQTGKALSKDKLKQLKQAYEKYRRKDGQLPMSFEIIYGHGFAPEQKTDNETSEAIVSLRRLRDRLT